MPKSVSERGGVILGNYFDNNLNALNFEIYSNGRPRVYFVKDHIAYDYIFDIDIRSDDIVHLAFVMDYVNVKLYLNGELKEEKQIEEGLSPVANVLFVGTDMRENRGMYFKGTLVSMCAFSEVRTEDKIKNDIIEVESTENNLLFKYCFLDNQNLNDYSKNNRSLKDEIDFKVGNVSELSAAAAVGAKNICITNDIVLDRTIYFVADTTLYAESDHTISRANYFGGDLFVAGENCEGRNLILDNKFVKLHIGSSQTNYGAAIVIDGNADNMTVDVTGTILFICNSAVVDIYDGVTIKNSYKVGNEKSYDETYFFSYPERVGGSMAIVANGTLNIYGGIFENNISGSADLSENDDSYLVGAIYNYSNLNIYGGTFTSNKAYNGGVAYNYRNDEAIRRYIS